MALSVAWYKVSPADQLAAVTAFQATEADGCWHLLRAFARSDDPKLQAIIFTHMLEEESHADAFVQVHQAMSPQAFVPQFYEREDLYPDDTPTWKRLAFVHVGEVDATQRFALLRDALPPGPLRGALHTIVQDEEGHIDLTHNWLLAAGATAPEIRSTYRQVRLQRLWEGWLRAGQRVVTHVAVLVLSAAYFVLGPFVAGSARRKLRQRVVEFDNNALKRA